MTAGRRLAPEGASMTEADWLKAKDPEAMLRLVEARFSPRRWHLLACAHARRALEVIPDDALKDAVEWAERHPGETHTHPDLETKLAALSAASATAAAATREAQREIVLASDPDADPDSFGKSSNGRIVTPSLPLFQAACRAAGESVTEAGEAVGHAFEGVAALLRMHPGGDQVSEVRRHIVEATRVRAGASLRGSSALKLKALGDEFADTDPGRSIRHRAALAEEKVRQEQEFTDLKHGDLHGQKEKADRKALGRFLHELVGNPFKAYRFEPDWRTGTVLGLARAVDEDRAFDRMPILADALLDADCDEEAILRHCRGTEAHAPEGPAHHRGCWVIDLILEKEPEFFSAPPVSEPAPRAATPSRTRQRIGGGWAQLFEAVRRGEAPEPDDEEEP
jgi:hypothetical protein